MKKYRNLITIAALFIGFGISWFVIGKMVLNKKNNRVSKIFISEVQIEIGSKNFQLLKNFYESDLLVELKVLNKDEFIIPAFNLKFSNKINFKNNFRLKIKVENFIGYFSTLRNKLKINKIKKDKTGNLISFSVFDPDSNQLIFTSTSIE